MSDSVVIDGLEYISSKRAAELCGYAQDYVGQLARAAKIDARRAAGHWYVNLESLREHTKNADARVPQTRTDIEVRAVDIITADDGAQYVSASRASKISGYHQDYIGQLARSSTVKARQVGNRWYVDLEMLLSHKKDKDSLLAAVQTASVGLSSKISGDSESPQSAPASTHYSYHHIEAPLIPVTNGANVPEDAHDTPVIQYDQPHRVPIRVHRGVTSRPSRSNVEARPPFRDMTKQILVGSVGLVIILGFVLKLAPFIVPALDGGTASTASVASVLHSGGSTNAPDAHESKTSDAQDVGLILEIIAHARSMLSDTVSYAR